MMLLLGELEIARILGKFDLVVSLKMSFCSVA